ncbi:MAG: TatD family hydrolase [Myxococcaceae bacterium]
MTPLFDAHLHPEGLSDSDLETLHLFGIRAALITAHHVPSPANAKTVLEHFDELIEKHLPRLEKAGLKGYAALGVHPQVIPRRGLSEILEALPGYFRGGKVIALGEIGLHEDSEQEQEAFLEQLRLARKLKLPVLVHTPDKDKERVTKRTLTVIRDSGIPASRVLVDHANGRTVRIILACGHYAGLTIHPHGLRAERALTIIRKLGTERLVVNTDAGDGAGDFLALARLSNLLSRANLSEGIIERVGQRNALELLRLPPSTLAN